MRYEWLVIFVLTILGAWFYIYFLKDAHSVAIFGWAFLTTGFLQLGYVVFRGKQAKRNLQGSMERMDAIGDHRFHIAIVTLMMILGVLAIEVAVRRAGGLWGNPHFVAFHLSLAFMMSVTFLLARFKYTGLKKVKHHWKLAYAFILLYGATLVTGTMLLQEKFVLFR